MKVTVRANAKINLSLDIVGKRDDDYHLLESVMQSVSLCDTVTVKTDQTRRITVETDDEEIADDPTNIAYRAAVAFFEQTGIDNPGIDIRIKKRIPVGAGMAGGSADGAAVITALNELFNTRLDDESMCDIGETVGADVPFCLTGGTMMARGTGNILSPLPDLPECYIVIAKPACGVSTAAAYRAVDAFEGRLTFAGFEDLGEDICAQDIPAVARRLSNSFEQVLELKESMQVKHRLLELGALGACMTGSGSAVFGVFDDRGDAEDCCDALEKEYDDVFLATPVARGCIIEE